MNRARNFVVSILVIMSMLTTTAEIAAASNAGGKCTKVGVITGIAKKTLVCKKVGKKLVWAVASSAGGKCTKVGLTTGTAKKPLVCKKVGKKLVWAVKSKVPGSSTGANKVPGLLSNRVQISFNRTSGLFFQWSTPKEIGSGPITGYRIEFQTLDTPWLFLQVALPSQSSITAKHDDLVGTTIRFRTAAVNAYGVGAYSESDWVQYTSTTGSTVPASALLPTATSTTTAAPTTTSTTVPAGTVSQRNAVSSAASYLKYSSFSRSGLISQLQYEGFSLPDATYGTDAQNANWNSQAVKTAASYLRSSSFSRSGLISQLQYEGFSSSEATYGVDAQSADWNVQAAKTAANYLKSSSFSRTGLISQLIYEGFTQAQAEYGVGTTGL